MKSTLVNNIKFCADCGVEIPRRATYCQSHYRAHGIETRKKNPIIYSPFKLFWAREEETHKEISRRRKSEVKRITELHKNTRCLDCKSNVTFLTHNGTPKWYKVEGGYKCSKCRRKGTTHSAETISLLKKKAGRKSGFKQPEIFGKTMSLKLKGRKKPKGHGQKVSLALKNKPRINGRGIRNGRYKGGITKAYQRVVSTFKYKIFRKAVYERDDYTCQMCLQVGGKLHAHHIIKSLALLMRCNNIVDNTSLDSILECDEIYDPVLAVTLCIKCHKQTDDFLVKYE